MACCSINKTISLPNTFLQKSDMIILKKINTSTWGGQLKLVITDGIRPPMIIAQVTTNYPDSILWELADQIYSSEYSTMFYWYPQSQSLMMIRKNAPFVMAKLEYDFPATCDVKLITDKTPDLPYADSFVRTANQICPQCNYKWDDCPNC